MQMNKQVLRDEWYYWTIHIESTKRVKINGINDETSSSKGNDRSPESQQVK